MKKTLALLMLISLLLTGCGSTPAVSTEPVATTTTAPTIQTTQPTIVEPVMQEDMSAVALPMSVDTLTAEDGRTLYTGTSQSMSLVVPDPDVADKIIIDFLSRQDALRTAAESVKSASESNSGATPYFHNAIFEPKRIDHNVLSLSGSIVSWSGSSHPNYNCISANYDMITGDVLTLGSILTHKDKAADLCSLVIDGIGKIQKEHSIWDGYEDTIRQRFSGNVSYDEGWFFDHLGLSFSFPPYELAPYNSGIITVNVPYEKLVGIIEDAFFPVEHNSTSGAVEAALLSEANMDDFTQIAELVLDEDGQMILLYTDSAVYDVTLQVDNTYEALATASLTPGDAIMVQADTQARTLILHYHSGENVVSRYIRVSEGQVELTEVIPE